MGARPKTVEEPEWLRRLPDGRLINSKDVAQVFGCSLAALNCRVYQGNFPQPDINGADTGRKNRPSQWKVSTIRAEIKRRNEPKGATNV